MRTVRIQPRENATGLSKTVNVLQKPHDKNIKKKKGESQGIIGIRVKQIESNRVNNERNVLIMVLGTHFTWQHHNQRTDLHDHHRRQRSRYIR